MILGVLLLAGGLYNLILSIISIPSNTSAYFYFKLIPGFISAIEIICALDLIGLVHIL